MVLERANATRKQGCILKQSSMDNCKQPTSKLNEHHALPRALVNRDSLSRARLSSSLVICNAASSFHTLAFEHTSVSFPRRYSSATLRGARNQASSR